MAEKKGKKNKKKGETEYKFPELAEPMECPMPDCDYVGTNMGGVKSHLRQTHMLEKDVVDAIVASSGGEATRLRQEIRKSLRLMGFRPEDLKTLQTIGERDMSNVSPPPFIEESSAPAEDADRSSTTPPPKKKSPNTSHAKVMRKSEEKVITMSEEPDLTKVAHLKGEMRQVLKKIAALPEGRRDDFLPEREQLVALMKALNSAKTLEAVSSIEIDFEDKVRPAVTAKMSPGPIKMGSSTSRSSTSEGIHLTTKHAKARSKLRSLIKRILNMNPEKQEELDSQRETLMAMNRQLGSESITNQEINEINNIVDNEIVPYINVVEQKEIKKAKPFADETDFDDWLEDSYKMKNREWQMMRMDRMMAEERSRFDMVHGTKNEPKQGNNIPPGMVPVHVPVIDPATGEQMRDGKGNPVMEMTYKPISNTDPTMGIILKSALEKDPNSTMIPMLTAMMDNNTKVLTAVLGQGKQGPDIEKIMLEMNNQNQQMMNNFQMAIRDKDDQTRNMMEQMRTQHSETLQALHGTQMGMLQKELDEMKHFAFQDPIDKMMRDKEKLKALGVVSEPTSPNATTEDKMVEEWGKLGREVGTRMDQGLQAVTELMKPITQAQAKYLEQTAEAKAPKKLSDNQKISHYSDILKRLDGTVEEDEEGDLEE